MAPGAKNTDDGGRPCGRSMSPSPGTTASAPQVAGRAYPSIESRECGLRGGSGPSLASAGEDAAHSARRAAVEGEGLQGQCRFDCERRPGWRRGMRGPIGARTHPSNMAQRGCPGREWRARGLLTSRGDAVLFTARLSKEYACRCEAAFLFSASNPGPGCGIGWLRPGAWRRRILGRRGRRWCGPP